MLKIEHGFFLNTDLHGLDGWVLRQGSQSYLGSKSFINLCFALTSIAAERLWNKS